MKQIQVTTTITEDQMLDLLRGWGYDVRKSNGELRLYRGGKYEGIAEMVFWFKYRDLVQELANRQGSVQ